MAPAAGLPHESLVQLMPALGLLLQQKNGNTFRTLVSTLVDLAAKTMAEGVLDVLTSALSPLSLSHGVWGLDTVVFISHSGVLASAVSNPPDRRHLFS